MNPTHSNGGDSAGQGARAGDLEARDKLMQDMKNVIHDAEDWLKAGAAQGGEELRSAQEHFASTLQTAKTDLLKVEANLVARTKLAAQATDAYVQEHPWQSVGLGAAVGVILGLLIARRQ
ncbi:glycine zipper domain-containing protein [Janthinobacterium sp.]|uniref:DUF883 family protein n=1 Tax=Janthinobacterium sp. TaxID=1871054 RepID=UPI00293D62DF|nr:DUF883 domain-containing protein [Janthinobacterium sp.]